MMNHNTRNSPNLFLRFPAKFIKEFIQDSSKNYKIIVLMDILYFYIAISTIYNKIYVKFSSVFKKSKKSYTENQIYKLKNLN